MYWNSNRQVPLMVNYHIISMAASFSSMEVDASYSDGASENAFGEYLIDSLDMDTQ